MSAPDAALRSVVESARERFLESVEELRPALHRMCSRMLGSVVDGEDAVQETLATAYYKLPTLRETPDERRYRAWVFRIGHNKCIDILRRRRFECDEEIPERTNGRGGAKDRVTESQTVRLALTQWIDLLPPEERASLLLKDVLGFTLEETAKVVGSSVGGVEAALHRARGKLKEVPGQPPGETVLDPAKRRLLEDYAERFSRQDWDAVVLLLDQDARLEVVEVFAGTGETAFTGLYFYNYSTIQQAWRFTVEAIDGDWMLVHHRRTDTGEVPRHVVRVQVGGGKVTAVEDYYHVPEYLVGAALGDA